MEMGEERRKRRAGEGDWGGVLASAMLGVDGAASEVCVIAVVGKGSSRTWPLRLLRPFDCFQLRLLGRLLLAEDGRELKPDGRVLGLGSGSGISESREDSSPSSADPEERLFMEKARRDSPGALERRDGEYQNSSRVAWLWQVRDEVDEARGYLRSRVRARAKATTTTTTKKKVGQVGRLNGRPG